LHKRPNSQQLGAMKGIVFVMALCALASGCVAAAAVGAVGKVAGSTIGAAGRVGAAGIDAVTPGDNPKE
jgi:cytosine/uracil/thiamine/allantoin permease